MYKYLRVFTCYAQDDWVDLLPMAQLALNSRPNTVIGNMSPFFLRHRYNISLISELTDVESHSKHPGKKSAERFVTQLKEAQEFAQAAMASS